MWQLAKRDKAQHRAAQAWLAAWVEKNKEKNDE